MNLHPVAVIVAGVVAGTVIATAVCLADLKSKPAPSGITLESAQKLCQWPRHPGEALFVRMNEAGLYECHELDRVGAR